MSNSDNKIAEIERMIVERMGGYCVVERTTDEIPCYMVQWSDHNRWQKMAVYGRDMESEGDPTAIWLVDYFVEEYQKDKSK